MKKANSIVIGSVAAAMLATVPFAKAEEKADLISANVTMATDYVFRGVSQTGEKGAIQGGFDYAHESGFYAGTWASNVEFGDVSSELDLYVGYGFELAEGVELDLSYIYFVYAGDESALNYSEFAAGLSFGDLGLGVVFSPDYFGSDESAVILSADYSLAISESVSLDLHVGYTDTDEAAFGLDSGLDSYVDYSVGLSTEYGGVGLSLAVTGTDADEEDEWGDAGEARLVFAISKEF